MPLTVKALKAAAQKVEPIDVRPGGFYLKPDVPVIHIETGKEMYAYRVVDETGLNYTNCLTVREDIGYWHRVETFELKK